MDGLVVRAGSVQPVRAAWAALALALIVASASLGGGGAVRPVRDALALSRLPVAAQSLVGRSVGRDTVAFRAVAADGRLRFDNPAQRITAAFTAGGVSVRSGGTRFGLALTRLGHGDALAAVPAAAPSASANRVTYRRGQLEEWYVNGPLGIEQGFTLHAAPAPRALGPLTLALRLHANVAVRPAKTGLSFGSSSLRYRGLAAYDARGKALPAWLELSGGTLLLRVRDAGARYPITVDPFVQQAELTASGGAANDSLGFAIATNGAVVAVGAAGANSRAGAVYVFVKPGTGWANGTETAKLTASDGVAGDSLGTAVAISSDGSTIVAGARRWNSLQGAAYVFVRGASWTSGTQTAKLLASDGVAGDKFGNAVAIDADTIVVGAPAKNSSTGEAYVFVKPGAGWASGTETARLSASDGAAGDEFGYAADISSGTIVVGARYKANFTGALYVYVKPGTGWATGTQTAKLVGASPVQYDELGQAVAIDGSTVVGGVPGKNSFAGAVYVFVAPGTGWANATPTAQLTASDGAANDQLGYAVDVSGTTVVGGAFHSGSMGAAYLFTQPGGGWANGTQTAKLTASDAVVGDNLGYSVAIAAGVVAAGAQGKNSSTGAAYVFADNGAPPAAPTVTSFAPTSGGAGTSVTIVGTNFTGATSVRFNGTSASFAVNTATQITATVPAGATTGPIAVTTGAGTATSSSSFTVVPSPTIASFSPTSGGVGTSVTVTGTNFTGATSVKFHGTSASFTVNTAAQITATVPSGATTGTISVTTPGGTATSSSSFTVVGAGPTISGFTPTSGPVGTKVTINGTNFTGVSAVAFNGRSAKFTVVSATQITATVPRRSTTGRISVTTSGGTATSSTSFTVT